MRSDLLMSALRVGTGASGRLDCTGAVAGGQAQARAPRSSARREPTLHWQPVGGERDSIAERPSLHPLPRDGGEGGETQCHSDSSTVMPSGPEMKTSFRLWKSMISFRVWTPLAVSFRTSASTSS